MVVSRHAGLPMGGVAVGRAKGLLRGGIPPAAASYIFNAAGQTIDLEGLLCLFDADGPCGNAVKDAQRTKTGAVTTRTLTVIWGTTELPGHATRAEKWYRELLHALGAETDSAKITMPAP